MTGRPPEDEVESPETEAGEEVALPGPGRHDEEPAGELRRSPAGLAARPPRDGGRWGAVVVGAAVLVVVVLGVVTVLGRRVSGPPAPLAVAVIFLPYLYATLAALLFGLWAVLPDRGALPVLLAAVVLGGTVLWAPSWPARGERGAEGEAVRVMSWNVRRLWGGDGDGGDPEACVVEAIRAEEPDVLTLLEVTGEDVASLASHLDLDCVHTDYLGTGSPRRGGLASCVRGDRWRMVDGTDQRFVDHDEWRYVFTEVALDGRVFNLLAVHLHPYWPLSGADVREGVRELARGEPDSLLDVGRTGEEVVRAQGAQSVALLERVAHFRDPTVMAGDFNSTRDAALHASLRATMVDAWQRGGRGVGATVHLRGWAPLRIDYVYVTEAFAVRTSRVPPVGCSDHRPVVADLVLRDRQ